MNYPVDDLQLYEPPYVELTVSDYGYAWEESLVWPDEWPDLDSPLTKRMEPGFVIEYVIAFPADQFDELRAYLSKSRTKGAILMSGKKVAVGWNRKIYPGKTSSEWMVKKTPGKNKR